MVEAMTATLLGVGDCWGCGEVRVLHPVRNGAEVVGVCDRCALAGATRAKAEKDLAIAKKDV